MAVSQYRTRSSKDNVFTFEKFWREVCLSLAELYFYLHHDKSEVRFYQNLLHTVKASKRCCYWKTDRKKLAYGKNVNLLWFQEIILPRLDLLCWVYCAWAFLGFGSLWRCYKLNIRQESEAPYSVLKIHILDSSPLNIC